MGRQIRTVEPVDEESRRPTGKSSLNRGARRVTLGLGQPDWPPQLPAQWPSVMFRSEPP